MVAVPFYIRFIGVEGYGLVGFYGTLRATLNSFLDFGLTATINREIARYRHLLQGSDKPVIWSVHLKLHTG